MTTQIRNLTLGLALVVAASVPARADDWGTPGFDTHHGRLTPERSGSLFADGRWTASFAGGAKVLASPVVSDGFVVTVDLDGAVRALRGDDGKLVWQAAAGSAVQGTPAVIKGRVYVPTLG